MKVGFIRLGAMGLPMAHKVGLTLSGYDTRVGPLRELRSWGANVCSAAGEVAAQPNAVITMLPDSNSVDEVVLGHAGVVESAGENLMLLPSPEGQEAHHRTVGAPPLRKDVPDIRPAALKTVQGKIAVVDLAIQEETTRVQREGTVNRLLGMEK